MQHKIITVTLLTVSLIFLLGSREAHSFSESHVTVIQDLPDSSKILQNSPINQFAVATINQPDNLQPYPLVMNDDQGTISSSNNYLAYTPRPSPTRPKGQQHSEIGIILSYPNALLESPCLQFTSSLISALANVVPMNCNHLFARTKLSHSISVMWSDIETRTISVTSSSRLAANPTLSMGRYLGPNKYYGVSLGIAIG